ncbi:hypothetical protein KP509_13G041400 [Ceratopteris richardii]|nr:hypothetical protein KP509_13G041400 [Ceratopteris richardii]
MPNMSIQELLNILSETHSPCNVQVRQILDTPHLDHILDPHLHPLKPYEHLQDLSNQISSPAVDVSGNHRLAKKSRTDSCNVNVFGADTIDVEKCRGLKTTTDHSHVLVQHNALGNLQGNHCLKDAVSQAPKNIQNEILSWTTDYKTKSSTKTAALSLSLDSSSDNYKYPRVNYSAELCGNPVYVEHQVYPTIDRGVQRVDIVSQTAHLMGQALSQQVFMQSQKHEQRHWSSNPKQEFLARQPASPYKCTNEHQEEIARQLYAGKLQAQGDVSVKAIADVHSACAVSSSDEEGLELLSLLLQCAEAVASENLNMSSTLIPILNEMSSPYGNPFQRVAAYFTEGMAARVLASCLGICSPLPPVQKFCNQNISSAFQTFNGLCPYVKFSHFTANQAILEAFEGHQSVHIIDCDIMQGLQWPALFHILASRPQGPPFVRITGIGISLEALEATGKRLSDFANTLCMPFEFHSVAERVGNLDLASLKVRPGEAVAVHWLQHSLYDVTGSDRRTLQLFQQLKPTVLTIVEQDLSHAGAFLDRFFQALYYYSALFDSLGARHAEASEERHVVEQQLFSNEMKNIVAVGGPARTGEEKYNNWRAIMSNAGFKQVSLAGNAATQATLLLNMFPNEGYSLMEEGGVLKLGWKDLSLYTASAWSWPASPHSS